MSQKLSRCGSLIRVLALAASGCASQIGVSPNAGAPAPGVGVLVPPPPPAPPPIRSAPPAPSAELRPAADDPLRSLAAWDLATSAERSARAQAIAPRLVGFSFTGLACFECGTQRHEVALFLHEATGMEFVLVPAGELTFCCVDAPKEMVRVRVDSPFLVARTETTVAAWNRVTRGGAQKTGPASRAVGNVSWNEASAFCRRAGLDLPSAAQWKTACQAGSCARFCCGDDDARYCEFAWSRADLGDDLSTMTLFEVGLKSPNAFGLFDVHGNAREWTAGLDDLGRATALGQGVDKGPQSWCRIRKPDQRGFFEGVRPEFTVLADPTLDATVRGLQWAR